jgi:UDP-4-amino-4,6-dideoxy-N-acetyl-beta-L-altrosamine transaminase
VIPYGRQSIDDADVQAVVAVLRSDFLTQGPTVPRFENAVADRCRAAHAVAVNSGTSALHVACMALRLAPGDALWTAPNTFVASANCARYCGAEVDFVDIDPDTWNLSVPALRDKLAGARRSGKLPKVVVPVHFGGQPTEQEAIWELAREFGFKVLEDACHSFGASRNGEPVGSCKWSHVTAFSFHPVKIITSAEGGMCTTNDAELAWRMAMLRSHGITRDPARMQRQPEGPWYYEQLELGYNYRLTDLHAALGLSQLARTEEFVARRNALAERYRAKLEQLPLQLPRVQPGNRSAFHLYVVRLKSGAARKTHREVFEALRERGIGVGLHYMPVHLQPYYRRLGFKPGDFPQAERYGAEAITLPLYWALTDHQQDEVAAALQQALRHE